MFIRQIKVEIDVQDYLDSKGLSKVKTVGDNVMACCPFHSERSPSFGVHVDTGTYNCFGCGSKGSFGHLVKVLDKFDTVCDAEDYLINVYGRYAFNTDESFDLKFEEESSQEYSIDDSLLDNYRFRHPYIESRGITEKWQGLLDIGFDKKSNAVTFGYRDEYSKLLTVKYRSVNGKKFWYKPSMPSRIKAETLWSFDKVLKWGLKHVAITEAEFDGASVWQANVGTVAIGGNQFTDEQANKLKRLLPREAEITIFTDNDSGGGHAKRLISEKLSGHFMLTEVDWSLIQGNPKDANDLTESQIAYLISKRVETGLILDI